MSRLFDFFKSPKQKLEDELKKLRQEIENDKYIKRSWIENVKKNQTVLKTDEQLEKEWRKAYSFINFDELGNDIKKLERMYELQTQIDTIIQEEEKKNQEERKINDAWRDARYQGLSRSGGKSGKSGKRKNKKNTKTKKIKNKSRRRCFKKRMQ